MKGRYAEHLSSLKKSGRFLAFVLGDKMDNWLEE